MMRKGYYIGIGVAAAGFAALIFREVTHHGISQGVVGGAIAAAVVVGCILMGFASEKKETGSQDVKQSH